jgi:hypothetical protein
MEDQGRCCTSRSGHAYGYAAQTDVNGGSELLIFVPGAAHSHPAESEYFVDAAGTESAAVDCFVDGLQAIRKRQMTRHAAASPSPNKPCAGAGILG